MANEAVKVAEESVRGGFFLIFGTFSATVIMAIASILIGRFLGPELYGQYTLSLVIPQILFILADLGINQGIIRFTSSLRARGETNRITKIIKYGMLVKVSTGIAIFIINYVFADFFASVILKRPDLAFYIRILSIGIVCQVISTTATSAFVGLDKTEYNAITSNVQALSKAAISIALVFLGFGVAGALTGFVAGYVFEASVSVSILFFILKQRQNTKSNHTPTDEAKTLVRYGAPIYIYVLLMGLVPLYQNIMLATFATDADVGNYKAAANFAIFMTALTIPITTALLPAFSKLESSANQKIEIFFKVANKYAAMIILPATVLVIAFSSEIVQLIYGSTFQSAPLFLAIYSLLFLLVGPGYLTLISFYNGLGETGTTLKVGLITFLIVVVLSPILAENYSVPGLITAFLVASAVGTSYGAYTAITKFRIQFETRSIIKIYVVSIFSCIPTLVLLQFLPLPQLVKVAVGALSYVFTYITLTPLTRIVNHSELQTAKYILPKIKLLTLITAPLLGYLEKILDLVSVKECVAEPVEWKKAVEETGPRKG